jgi:hypothetical protein
MLLRFCEQFGLTAAARARIAGVLDPPQDPAGDGDTTPQTGGVIELRPRRVD